MEHFPVEVIGNILSQLKAARDVVIASTTCKKWREAFRNHLHTLSFNSNDWPVYHGLTMSRLESLITRTIFQTKGLQNLLILMDDVARFSAAPVIAWLMYTGDTLCQFYYNVRTTPDLNILGKCGWHNLEVLALAHNSIMGIEPCYQKFPRLRSLILSYVSISSFDLSLLVAACPKIETLSLIKLHIDISESIKLTNSSLKFIYVKTVDLDKFILEADSLEKLHLEDCTLEIFELIGKGALRDLMVNDSDIFHFDIGENTDNLEVVDIGHFMITWPMFYNMISRSSKLARLRLWRVVFDYEDEVADLENMSICFPQLTHLSLSYEYELRDERFHHGLYGSSQLDHVVVLELGWTVIGDSDLFMDWVAGLVGRCPSLRKLVIYGVVSRAETHEECQILANFTSSIVQLMRKYMHIEVQFEYD